MGNNGVAQQPHADETAPAEPSFDVDDGSEFGVPAPTSNGTLFEEPLQPTRKQRRVRDPYAIDEDSDDALLAAPAKPKRTEESLIDFLNNVPPPAYASDPSESEAAPAPEIARTSPPRKNQSKRNTLLGMSGKSFTSSSTKPSASSSSSKPSAPPQQGTSLSRPPGSAPRAPSTAPQLQLSNAGRDSPLFPRTGSVGISNGTASSTPAPSSNLSRQAISSATYNVPSPPSPQQQQQPKKVLEPRSANYTTSSSDLANFLKNSGPPESATGPPPLLRLRSESSSRPTTGVTSSEKDRGAFGGFRNMFRRGKRGVAA
jgi:hypothetical protein